MCALHFESVKTSLCFPYSLYEVFVCHCIENISYQAELRVSD